MIIEQKLKDIQTRASEIEAQMNSGNVSGDELTKLSKEYSRISEILPLINEYFQTTAGIADATEMQHDPELRSIAVEQLAELNHALPEIEKKLQIALLPRDDADDNSVIMEIRAGVGGEESALFAGDLYNQYKSYALRHGWQVEVVEENAQTSVTQENEGGYNNYIGNDGDIVNGETDNNSKENQEISQKENAHTL